MECQILTSAPSLRLDKHATVLNPDIYIYAIYDWKFVYSIRIYQLINIMNNIV